MANLQIKGMDDRLYQQLKDLAADENRSVSQQVLFMIRRHLAQQRGHREEREMTAAQILLELSGAWEDDRSADQIIADMRGARRFTRSVAETL